MTDTTIQRTGDTQRAVCVLVLGAHRSGTSALTRVLSLRGCTLPATLMDCGNGNEKGHWESQPISGFNDALLDAAGTNWSDWQAFNANWYESPVFGSYLENASRLLRDEYDGAPFFVLKDPRMCRIAPFWLKVLDTANVDTRVVLPIRDPSEMAQSLNRRDGTDVWAGKLLWLRHVLDAELFTRGRRRVFTSYSDLLIDWRRVVEKISGDLDIVFPQHTVASDQEVDQFIVSEQRGHQEIAASLGSAVNIDGVAEWIKQSRTIFLRWASGSEDEEDLTVLDLVRDQLDRATDALAPILYDKLFRGVPGQGQTNNTGSDDLHQKIAAVTSKFEIAETQISTLRMANVALTERNEGLQSEIDSLAKTNSEDSERNTAEISRLRHISDTIEQIEAENISLRDRISEGGENLENQVRLSQAKDRQIRSVKTRLRKLRRTLKRIDHERSTALAARTEYDREKSLMSQIILDRDVALEMLERNLKKAILDKDQEIGRLILQSSGLVQSVEGLRSKLRHLNEMLKSAEATVSCLEAERSEHIREISSLSHLLVENERAAAQNVRQLQDEVDLNERRKLDFEARAAELDDRLSRSSARVRHLNELLAEARQERAVPPADPAPHDELAALSRLLFDKEQAWTSERAVLVADYDAVLAKYHELNHHHLDLSAKGDDAQAEIVALKTKVQEFNHRQQGRDIELSDRFRELAKISHMLLVSDQERERAAASSHWLLSLTDFWIGRPRWWALVPRKTYTKLQYAAMKRRGIFDASAYLALHSDVSAAGMDPLRHYILHGIQEGRQRSL